MKEEKRQAYIALAKTYHQFRVLTKERWTQFDYLFNVQDIRGRSDAILVVMGDWYSRKDVASNEERLLEYCAQHNTRVVTLDEWKLAHQKEGEQQ